MAAAPTSWYESTRKSSPKPGSRLSSMASTASKVESREVMPVPPVRMTACTAGSAHASRMTRWTSAGSSRTMPLPTTRWPAPARMSRMRAPLVSVCGVFVSEIVRTQQPTEAGALALCSAGVLAGAPSGAMSAVQDLDQVQHLDADALRAQSRLDLQDAPGIGGDHRLGPGGPDVADLAPEQARGHLGLREVVDAGRAAAPVGLGELDEAELRDLAQQLSRRALDLLAVHDVARVVIGHGQGHRTQRSAQGRGHEELGDVLDRGREAPRPFGIGGVIGEQRAIPL